VPADHEGELKVLATNSLEPELFSGCMFDDLFFSGNAGRRLPQVNPRYWAIWHSYNS